MGSGNRLPAAQGSGPLQPTRAHLVIAVNVSVRQFRQPDFVEQAAVLKRSGADPHKLKLV